MIPKNLVRKVKGWSLLASLFIAFPIAGFYFLRNPTNDAMETAFMHIILSGLFLLYTNLIIYLGLVVYNLISKREQFSEKLKPLTSK
jgi:hypothetical protein